MKIHSHLSKLTQRQFVLISLFLILIVVSFIYVQTLDFGFVFDDNQTILQNKDIHTLTNIGSLWKVHRTRFTSTLSYALNYYFGKYNAATYHLLNLIIHYVNGIAVFFLITVIQKTPLLKKNNLSKIRTLPLIISLIFVSHPIQTQAVSYLAQRSTIIVALFYFSCIVFYLNYRLETKKIFWKNLFLLLSFISAFFAFISKENSYSLPVSIILTETSFFGFHKKKIKYYIFLTLSYIFIAFGLYIFTIILPYGNYLKNINSITSMTHDQPISRFSYLLTELSVIRTYIRLLILPYNQNIDYDYRLSKNLLDLPTLLSFIFLFSIIFTAIKFRKKRMIFFGIFFFFIALSVESSIIPIADVIFEHRLYLPSLGFIIILVTCLYKLFESKNIIKYFYTVITVWIFCLSFVAFNRNHVWTNEVSLWTDSFKKSPNKSRTAYNLGVALADAGNITLSKKQFEKTIELNPKYIDAYHNLAYIYETNQNYQKAEEYYNLALAINPSDGHIQNGLGSLYIKEGRFQDALKQLSSAYEKEPKNVSFILNYALANASSGNMDKAILILQNAMKIYPSDKDILYNLGTYYYLSKKDDLAIDVLQKCTVTDTENPTCLLYLGEIYKSRNDNHRASIYYQKILNINPNFTYAKKVLEMLNK